MQKRQIININVSGKVYAKIILERIQKVTKDR